jgi:hypothetical protein
LRLQEEATTSYHLGRILKKYKRITVKNRGSFIDFPYQDLVVSVASGDALNSSDENIIKYIIFNACVGRTWVCLTNTHRCNSISLSSFRKKRSRKLRLIICCQLIYITSIFTSQIKKNHNLAINKEYLIMLFCMTFYDLLLAACYLYL